MALFVPALPIIRRNYKISQERIIFLRIGGREGQKRGFKILAYPLSGNPLCHNSISLMLHAMPGKPVPNNPIQQL
ncbi:MAG: hypothetical protein WCI31_09170 [Prolixibacteraceae bacterium]